MNLIDSARVPHVKDGRAARSPSRGSFDAVSLLPEKCPGARETEDSPWKLQFDNRPHPDATHRGCLFHDGHVASRVGDVNQVAPSTYARGKEYGLAEGGLISQRQTGD